MYIIWNPDNVWLNTLHNVALYIFATIGFTWFDYIGFHKFITKRYDRKMVPKVIYRVIQTIVQWGLFLYIYFISPIVAVLYIGAWWFGVCDHIYYIFNDDERDWYFTTNKKDMPWLWWTAYGMLNKKWRNNHTSSKIAAHFDFVALCIIIFTSIGVETIKGLF